jgi:hypothetical protein
MDRAFADRFTATRARLVGEFREAHPFRDMSEERVITRADVDRLSRATGWATRVGSGAYSFDWGVAARALDRPLSPFEQRILRESVFEPESDDVQGLVDSLNEFLAD